MSPLHEYCLRPFLAAAAESLASRRFGRCLCDERGCQEDQLHVEAWHIRWAMFDESGHDAGDEDRRDEDLEKLAALSR